MSSARQHLLEKYIQEFALDAHLNKDLLGNLRLHQFAAQDEICVAGLEQTDLYFLVMGKAQVNYYLASGKRSIVAIVTPLTVIGDVELLFDENLQLNVHASENSICLSLEKAVALKYGYDDPRFLRFIIRQMSRKLHGTDYVMLASDLPLINRFAIYLLNQVPLEDGTILLERKSDLADFLGISSRHLNRVINTLESEGILRVTKHRLHILDKVALQKYGDL